MRFTLFLSFPAQSALIRLNRPAVLNEQVSLICLPNQGYNIPARKRCYAAGNYLQEWSEWILLISSKLFQLQ